ASRACRPLSLRTGNGSSCPFAVIPLPWWRLSLLGVQSCRSFPADSCPTCARRGHRPRTLVVACRSGRGTVRARRRQDTSPALDVPGIIGFPVVADPYGTGFIIAKRRSHDAPSELPRARPAPSAG